MPMQHALELFRSNRQARSGLFVSVLLVVLMMGWMALAYARLNPYLILISFPMFNAVFIVLISVILIRAENENLTKLRTIPEGIRKTLNGHVTVAFIVVVVLNAFFEILAIVFREFLTDALGQILPPIDYTPDPITLLLFILCSVSFYNCFAGFSIWLFSESKITPAMSGEELSKLEGFVSVKFILVLALIVLASSLLYHIVQTAVTSAQGNMAIEPAIMAMLSFVFNVALSVLLWYAAWKAIK